MRSKGLSALGPAGSVRRCQPGSRWRAVIDALRQSARELDDGALLSVDSAPARSRLLPLREQ
jgi:hypothetical protein